MGIFRRQISVIDRIPEVVRDSIKQAITQYESELIEFIRVEQLKKRGEDGEQRPLGEYSLGYRRLRISKGLQVNYIDLIFSGKFVRSIRIVAENDQFRVMSNVEYDTEILNRFGRDVLKIQRKYMEQFVQERVLPLIRNNVTNEFAKSRIA
jgi:hypothetical protein